MVINMKNKKIAGILGILLLMLCLYGCGGQQEEDFPTSEEETAETEETAEEEIIEEEAAEEETVPVYVEDTNVYGNTIGNSYNDGVIVYDEAGDCLYFYDIYEGGIVKTSAETGHTVQLTDIPLSSLNLYDGKLYGVGMSEEGAPFNVQMYDLQTGSLEVVRENPVKYLQLVNGELYYTDGEDNTLRRMRIESGEEEILVDEPVYFPVVYKDMIVFQLDSDKESLYSMPRDGGDPVKLNDIRSYNPVIYHDKIYYKTIDDNEQSALRKMNLDGSEEEVMLEKHLINVNLFDGKFYYIADNAVNKLNYIDLSDEDAEIRELELGDHVRKALKEVYGTQGLQIDRISYIQFAGDYLLFMCEATVDGIGYMDEYLYKMDTEELFIIPEYCVDKEEDAAQGVGSDIQQPAGVNNAGAQINEQLGAAASATTDKDVQARAVAQSIADSIPAGSDLERVRAAAAIVAGYCANATYTSSDPDYRSAYGVFCKGVYTCAGSTRALGLVLDCMGYSWTHVNPNNWTHQWCELSMDGQAGWADGMGGIADYGACPFATGGSYTAPDGKTYFVP